MHELVPVRLGLLALAAAALSAGCADASRSTAVTHGPPATSATDLALPSASGPPPPDLLAVDLLPAACQPCKVTGPGTFCGLTIGITPFVPCTSSICLGDGGILPAFQSDPGTGQSHTITITISDPINWVSIDILDPDFPGNTLKCFDANGVQIGSTVSFPSDGKPGVLTSSMMGTGGMGIVKVVLEAPIGDYVAYDNLSVVPAGCGVPVL